MYHKTGSIIRKLCDELIDKNKGDRIDSITNYATKFDVARGTIQNAFAYLKDVNAIKTLSRGQLGTYLEFIDINKIINIANRGGLVGVMPLPYSVLYQGFATGLFLNAQHNNIDLQMAFMRGSKTRVEMLINGNYDFVVMSMLSASFYLKEFPDLTIAVRFGEKTYLKARKLIFSSNNFSKINDGMRVGVDFRSKDMIVLTEKQCEGKNVEFVSVPYMQLLSEIQKKNIDVALMNTDDLLINDKSLNIVSIEENYMQNMDTEAVLVIKKTDKISRIILKNIIDKENIVKIQNDVLKGNIDPVY